jgi:hypothetical protein
MSTSYDDDRDEVGRLSWWATAAMTLGFIGLPFLFGFLTINKEAIFSVIQKTGPDLIAKGGVWLYFFSWFFGAPIDHKLQKAVVVKDPHKGRLTVSAVVATLATIGAGGLLIYSTFDLKYLGWALLLFWAVHSLAILYMRHFMGGMYKSSAEWYLKNRDFFRLEKVLVLVQYQFGRMIWIKHLVGAGLAVLLVILSLSESARRAVASILSLVDKIFVADVVAPLVPASFFVLFVLVVEGCQWTLRISAIATFFSLSNLKKTYQLTPLRELQRGAPQ